MNGGAIAPYYYTCMSYEMADIRLLSLETFFKINFDFFLSLNFKVMKRVQQAK